MNITTDVRGEALLAHFTSSGDRLVGDLRKVITRRSVTVQGAVKESKLTGQVLHVRSGTLRRSVNRRVEETPTSIVATVGTNVKYGKVHEYGFSGVVSIPGHVRKVATQSVKVGRKQIAQGIAFVRAHTRKLNLPQRSFLRSTLLEQSGEIRDELRATVLAAVRP